MISFSSRQPGRSRLFARFLGLILPGALLLGVPLTARAADLGFKIEPGLAFPLTQQQSTRFDLGGGVPIKALYGLGQYADLTASVSFLGLPRSTGSLSSTTGTGWGYGGGLRLKSPRDSESFYGMSPWIDADALYVRTGELNRFGFAAGAGLAFPLGQARKFWLGPYLRYQQIVGSGSIGIDGRDAKVVLAGLSFEFGTSPMHPFAAAQPAVFLAPAVASPVAMTEPDRDNDGTYDKDDWCPDVVGPFANHGCPVYEKVVIKPDKLELKDKIQFDWNSPRIEPASHAALDEAVRALQDNRSFRVQLEGHASSEGADEHNQTLSEERAQAVLDYLVSHGVGKERVASKGFSSSRPLESNVTASGREANRRVEFIVHFIILEKGNIQ
jgi:outer membrane protein OmpA-like peptidoglycan-associated protein